MISLTDLATRLETAVPARGGIPANYDQLVKDAVLQLSQDVPLVRTAILNVVAGTAVYDLPSDFLSLIALPKPASNGDVAVLAAGLIPLGVAGWDERYEIAGGQIVFTPAPAYNMARTLRYASLYLLDGSNGYPTLTENLARVALLYARGLALSEQSSAVAGDGWKYQMGDEMVDKSNQGKSLATSADAMLTRYQAAVKQLKGFGGTAQYHPGLVF